MKFIRGLLAGILMLTSAAAWAQSNGGALPPVLPPDQKLADDTLTVAEARTYLANFEAERATLEAARKQVLHDGAKSTPEERGKLIAKFRTAQKDRVQRIHDMAQRAADLTIKLRDAEKAAARGGN